MDAATHYEPAPAIEARPCLSFRAPHVWLEAGVPIRTGPTGGLTRLAADGSRPRGLLPERPPSERPGNPAGEPTNLRPQPPNPLSNLTSSLRQKMTRLYSKGRVLGHQRGKHVSHPRTSLLKIENVDSSADAQFYCGKVSVSNA